MTYNMYNYGNCVTITDDTNWNTIQTLTIDSTTTWVIYLEVTADGICHNLTGVFKNGVQIGTTVYRNFISGDSTSLCQFSVDSSNVYVQVKNTNLITYNSYMNVDTFTP